jgi:hypothetical protein
MVESLEIVETGSNFRSEFISEFSNLKNLRLTGPIIFDMKNINPKAPLENLYLDIQSSDNINFISNFHKHLKKLYISARVIDIDNTTIIYYISKCINLVKLKINFEEHSSLGDDLDVFRPLINLDKLKVLDMYGVSLKMKQIAVLNEIPNLKFVNLPIKFYYKMNGSNKIQYSFKSCWRGFSKKNILYYRRECHEIRLQLI